MGVGVNVLLTLLYHYRRYFLRHCIKELMFSVNISLHSAWLYLLNWTVLENWPKNYSTFCPFACSLYIYTYIYTYMYTYIYTYMCIYMYMCNNWYTQVFMCTKAQWCCELCEHSAIARIRMGGQVCYVWNEAFVRWLRKPTGGWIVHVARLLGN